MAHKTEKATRPRSLETNDRILDLSQSIQIDHQTIEDAITGFAESVKIGIKVLDELAKLHPFIAAPVLAFKLVVSLDMKRRENNTKVIAVMVQIQDMLSVLLQLRDIKDTTQRSPDGTLQVTGELRNLMKRIAEDIEKCASRVIFTLRKAFFHLSPLCVSTNRGTCLLICQSQFKELFKRLDTPKEREIRMIIEGKGGAGACLDDESVLQELVSKSEDDSFRRRDKDHYSRGASISESNAVTSIQDIQNILRQELLEDLDEVLNKNLELFKGKLDIQNKEIKDSIEKQGDRIISYISGGHEKIINPHIRAIWRDMGWRGSIKAVNFVFALRDYFLSQRDDTYPNSLEVGQPTFPQPTVQLPSSPPTSTAEPQATDFMTTSGDEWTKKYINISHLQSILESIDDDGSGFISIREVNRFTLDCPRDWRKMFMLLEKARRYNRMPLHIYLNTQYILKLEGLLRSTKDRDNSRDDPELTKLVNTMTQEQDLHLKQNLESIHYKLDSVSTVQLVCGPGRIDKHIFPLLYALLQQHVKIFQLARIHIIHYDELESCTDSLVNVLLAFDARCKDLKATFKQMQINPETQFENFAFGMFKASEMKADRQNSTYLSVVSKMTLDPNEDDDVKNCFVMEERNQFRFSRDGLLRISINESPTGSGNIVGQAQSYIEVLHITGTYTAADSGDPIIEMVMKYDEGFWFHCRGIFSRQRLAIIGNWRQEVARIPSQEIKFQKLRKTSSFSFKSNPSLARWRFALDAVMYDVQRKRMSKDLIIATMHKALRFKNIALKRVMIWNDYSVLGGSGLTEEEETEINDLEMSVPPTIARFFYSIAYHIFDRLPNHPISCNNCHKSLIQSRIFCITCRDETLDGFDLCLGCINAKDPEPFKDYIHDASHSLIMCEYPIAQFQLPSMVQKAREMSERIKSVFRSIEESEKKKKADNVDSDKEEDHGTTTGKKCCHCENVSKNKFVCDSCAEKKLFPPLPYKVNLNMPPTEQHIMLRIVNSEKAKLVEKDGLVRVEERLENVKQEMDRRLGEMEEKVLERSKTLEGKLEEHLYSINQPNLDAANANANENEDSTKHTNSWEKRMEERLSAIESRFSSLEGTLLDLLAVLHDQRNS
ncbi:hypothetical protein BDQ17DRAFT_1363767 [Cyathus striatus]|nr:hypothetical protein BDQ17DRAFT_1363767 [Cyathus striatus]